MIFFNTCDQYHYRTNAHICGGCVQCVCVEIQKWRAGLKTLGGAKRGREHRRKGRSLHQDFRRLERGLIKEVKELSCGPERIQFPWGVTLTFVLGTTSSNGLFSVTNKVKYLVAQFKIKNTKAILLLPPFQDYNIAGFLPQTDGIPIM